jgi:hypothetical protein
MLAFNPLVLSLLPVSAGEAKRTDHRPRRA